MLGISSEDGLEVRKMHRSDDCLEQRLQGLCGSLQTRSGRHSVLWHSGYVQFGKKEDCEMNLIYLGIVVFCVVAILVRLYTEEKLDDED